MHATPDAIQTRAVLFFSGYERASEQRQYRRLTRELARFAKTWNLETAAGEPETGSGEAALRWQIDTGGPNWHVKTHFHYCAWNDLIAKDFDRPQLLSTISGIGALLDFMLTGTAFRYFAVAWRYGLFFTYALLLVALPAVVAALIAAGIDRFVLTMPWYLQAVVAAVLFGLLIWWPGSRFQTRYMLNDWAFAAAISRSRRRDYAERIEAFSRQIRQVAEEGKADEILIVGHSLGAVLAIDALAGALRQEPGLTGTGRPVTVMTIGSSLLKVGLHPAARPLRDAVTEVLSDPEVAWIDYTAVVDALNFYRCDPVRILKLPVTRSPVIRTVKISAMLSQQAYGRFKHNLLRLHRQFVMGNERRYHYDFFMSCCGPMPIADRIANLTLSVENFAEDGTYLPQVRDSDAGTRPATCR